MNSKNQSPESLAAEVMDAVAPQSFRQALRRLLNLVWTDEWQAMPVDDEPDNIGHSFYLVARWLYHLELATASVGEENPDKPAKKTRLLLKDVLLTAGAAAEIPGEDIIVALRRHCFGDWGDLCESDRMVNDHALQCGERILSAYRTQSGVKFWVITDAGHELATVLLPSEY